MSRRHRGEDGVVGDVLSLLFDVSKSSPIAGLVIAILFAVAAAYLRWIAPKSLYGLGALFGTVGFFAAATFGCMSIVGVVHDRLDGRCRALRFQSVFTLDDLRAMNWSQFEQLVADTYRRQGYRVREIGGSADGGIDLVLERGEDVAHLVQCKQYRVWDVGEPKVREFYGAMAAYRTRCEGIFVTCGHFTKPARRFAEGKPLHLVDGDELLGVIRRSNAVAPAVEHFADKSTAPCFENDSTVITAPACPSCGAAMRRRRATKGAMAGRDFWGCSTFPRCRGTRPI